MANRKTNGRNVKLRNIAFLPALPAVISAFAMAQSQQDKPASGAAVAGDRLIEDLNFRGGDAAVPLFSDSFLGADSSFRKALLSKGMTLPSRRAFAAR